MSEAWAIFGCSTVISSTVGIFFIGLLVLKPKMTIAVTIITLSIIASVHFLEFMPRQYVTATAVGGLIGGSFGVLLASLLHINRKPEPSAKDQMKELSIWRILL
jgi:hypothetical protein